MQDYERSLSRAADLFRITQTEEKIKAQNIKGKRAQKQAGIEVGKMVRKAMIKISGLRPKNLPLRRKTQKSVKKSK